MLTVFTLLPTHSPVSILPDPSQSSPYTPPYTPSILLTCVQGLTGQKHQQKRWKTSEHPPQKPLGNLGSQMPKYPPGLPSEARAFFLQATLLIVTPSLCLHCDCLIWPSHHSVLNFSLSGIISHRLQRTSNVISGVFSESKRKG